MFMGLVFPNSAIKKRSLLYIPQKSPTSLKEAGLINLIIQQTKTFHQATYKALGGISPCVEIPGLSNSPYPIVSVSLAKPV